MKLWTYHYQERKCLVLNSPHSDLRATVAISSNTGSVLLALILALPFDLLCLDNSAKKK